MEFYLSVQSPYRNDLLTASKLVRGGEGSTDGQNRGNASGKGVNLGKVNYIGVHWHDKMEGNKYPVTNAQRDMMAIC